MSIRAFPRAFSRSQLYPSRLPSAHFSTTSYLCASDHPPPPTKPAPARPNSASSRPNPLLSSSIQEERDSRARTKEETEWAEIYHERHARDLRAKARNTAKEEAAGEPEKGSITAWYLALPPKKRLQMGLFFFLCGCAGSIFTTAPKQEAVVASGIEGRMGEIERMKREVAEMRQNGPQVGGREFIKEWPSQRRD